MKLAMVDVETTTVKFSVTFLAVESLDFGDGHTLDTNVRFKSNK